MASVTGEVDLSSIGWVDVWPLAQLAKLIRLRRQAQRPSTVLLPHWPIPKKRLNKSNKPLRFLVDIGFVSLAMRLGARVGFKGALVQPRLWSDVTRPTGLAQESEQQLLVHGYRIREYKDKIILPFQELDGPDSVEKLRQRLSDYVEKYANYYEEEITDAHLVDTFFRELCENAVEHGGKGGLVAARMMRSPWDAKTASRRKELLAARELGKLPRIKSFLKEHSTSGYLELVVADFGPGILGTGRKVLGPEALAMDVFRWSLRPDSSQQDPADRLRAGKSPLTGLGECSNQLARLPALMTIREQTASCSIRREPNGDSDSGASSPRIRVMEERNAYERDIGCNLQLSIAIPPRASRGIQIDNRTPQPRVFQALVLIDGRNSDRPITRLGEIQGRWHQRPENAVLCVVDATGLARDKNTASHLLRRLEGPDIPRPLPLIVVGLDRPMVDALLRNMLQDATKDVGSPSRAMFLAPMADGTVLALTADAELRAYVTRSLKDGRFARQPSALFDLSVTRHGLCDSNGNPTLFVADCFPIWRSLIGARLKAEIDRPESQLLVEDWVELPSGHVVGGIIDLAALLRDRWATRQIGRGIELAMLESSSTVVVSATSGIRHALEPVLRRYSAQITHVPLPDPYHGSVDWLPRIARSAESALLVTDAVYSGTHTKRLVARCLSIGLKLVRVLTVVDASPAKTTVNVGAPLEGIVRLPALAAPEDTKAKLWIDGYTLSIRRKHSEAQPQIFRSDEEGHRFYNHMRQCKALTVGHCVNGGGHHSSVGISFRHVLGPGELAFALDSLKRLVNRSQAVVYIEGSSIGESLQEWFPREYPDRPLVSAVASTRVVREYSFGAEDQANLEAVASNRGSVLVVDDALHTGKALGRLSSALARLGIGRIQAWVILNNAPPGAAAVSEIKVEMAKARVEFNWLFRGLFPLFASARSCPFCVTVRALEEANRPTLQPLLAEHLRLRSNALRAVDTDELAAPPVRHLSVGRIRVPRTSLRCGIPEFVTTTESVELAFQELGQFEEGLGALARVFSERIAVEHDARIVQLLSRHLWTLDKMGLLDGFMTAFSAATVNGPECAEVVECALLWPSDILVREVKRLASLLSAPVAAHYAGIATLYAVLREAILRNGQNGEQARGVVQTVVDSIDEGNVQKGIAATILAALDDKEDEASHSTWAITLLVHSVRLHRARHHRILEDLTKQATQMSVGSIPSIMGTGNEGPKFVSLFARLADLLKALRGLIAAKRLSEGGARELVDNLQRALEIRTRLTSVVDPASSKVRDPESPTVKGYVEELRDALRRIHSLLPGSDKPVDSELGRLLAATVCDAVSQIAKPIADRLGALCQVQRDDDADEAHVVVGIESLEEPLIRDIVQNVKDALAKVGGPPLLQRVSVRVRLRLAQYVRVEVTNQTVDPTAAHAFNRGRSRRDIGKRLAQFLGDVDAVMESSDRITTRITLRAV
jgi:hypothetical protein